MSLESIYIRAIITETSIWDQFRMIKDPDVITMLRQLFYTRRQAPVFELYEFWLQLVQHSNLPISMQKSLYKLFLDFLINAENYTFLILAEPELFGKHMLELAKISIECVSRLWQLASLNAEFKKLMDKIIIKDTILFANSNSSISVDVQIDVNELLLYQNTDRHISLKVIIPNTEHYRHFETIQQMERFKNF